MAKEDEERIPIPTPMETRENRDADQRVRATRNNSRLTLPKVSLTGRYAGGWVSAGLDSGARAAPSAAISRLIRRVNWSRSSIGRPAVSRAWS